MRRPSVDDLPAPPSGKVGWPWTKQSPAGRTLHNAIWPRVSIVTASYNQAAFLEETIRSVLLQGYPDLEYLVMDGGSDDGSVEIIRKYSEWLTHWRTAPDRGQSHAINEGFARTTGGVMGWINSDDVYLPGALFEAARHLAEGRESDWLTGGLEFIDASGAVLSTQSAFLPSSLRAYRLFENERRYVYCIHQPATFWSRHLWMQCGPLNETLHYCMDRTFWMEAIARGYDPHRTRKVLARFRVHELSKSVSRPPRFAFEGACIHFRQACRAGFRTTPNLRLAQRLVLRGVRSWLTR